MNSTTRPVLVDVLEIVFLRHLSSNVDLGWHFWQGQTVMSRRPLNRRRFFLARLNEMIEEATVDAYGEVEQKVGFFTVMEERLKLPFKTEILGVEVTVERQDLTDDEQIVAVCSRGKSRESVPILDLILPNPPPGAEWIEAFRRWAQGG